METLTDNPDLQYQFSRRVVTEYSPSFIELLYEIQSHEDIGYFNKYFAISDPNSLIPPKYFTGHTFMHNDGTNGNIPFMEQFVHTMADIFESYNNFDNVVVYAQQSKGLTIVLKNCVVRTMSFADYNAKKEWYLELIKPRDQDSFMNYHEMIYRIYVYEDLDLVIVVSEKLVSVRDHATMMIRKQFAFSGEDIVDNIQKAREIMHHHSFLHRDLSLDNTGYRESDNRFVVFDYGMSVKYSGPITINLDFIRGYNV